MLYSHISNEYCIGKKIDFQEIIKQQLILCLLSNAHNQHQ